METVIIITELKLTTTVNELYERQHLKSRAFSTRAFSHIGRFRLTPAAGLWYVKHGAIYEKVQAPTFLYSRPQHREARYDILEVTDTNLTSFKTSAL